MVDKKPDVNPHDPADRSYTIGEFCVAEGIGQTLYFKLRKQGLGPKEMRLGSAVRISQEARRAWHLRMEKIVDREGLQKRSRLASEKAKKALASPNHGVRKALQQRRASA